MRVVLIFSLQSEKGEAHKKILQDIPGLDGDMSETMSNQNFNYTLRKSQKNGDVQQKSQEKKTDL